MEIDLVSLVTPSFCRILVVSTQWFVFGCWAEWVWFESQLLSRLKRLKGCWDSNLLPLVSGRNHWAKFSTKMTIVSEWLTVPNLRATKWSEHEQNPYISLMCLQDPYSSGGAKAPKGSRYRLIDPKFSCASADNQLRRPWCMHHYERPVFPQFDLLFFSTQAVSKAWKIHLENFFPGQKQNSTAGTRSKDLQLNS